MSGPAYGRAAALGDRGIDLVSLLLNRELGWITRQQPRSDVGIDVHIEIVSRGRATGRLLAAQVKCGSSFFAESDQQRIVFRPKAKHADYWLNFSLPVLVVLCDPDTETCFWQAVGPQTLRSTDKGYRIDVPRSQTLGADAGGALMTLAPKQQIIPGLLDVCLVAFLAEKYGRDLAICPVIESPRDYHYFPLLAEIKRRLVSIAWVQTADQPSWLELIAEIVSWRAYNDRSACQVDDVMLFAIGTPGDLPRVPDEAMQAAADAGVEIFRLVYDPTDARWTYEINANDELLEWFPSFGDATAYPMPGWWGATEQS